MPTSWSMPDAPNRSAARLPVIVLVAMLVVAVILGLATRAIDDDFFARPVATSADPITIP